MPNQAAVEPPVHTAKIINGREVSKDIRQDCRDRIAKLQEGGGPAPGLSVILVGDDPASNVYVGNKIKACREVGVISQLHRFESDANPDDVIDLIEKLNTDAGTHGILVQLPLPPHFDIKRILHAISVEKDVDGFHLYNVGGLVMGDTVFSPCTPYGVTKLLEYENIPITGQNVVIVGASNIVGKPMALMMMKRDATVAVCHAKTRDLAQFTILADILIVAAGVPNLILPQMVKTGAVVIDVGLTKLPNGRLVGDVDFEGVKQKASYITPVPGGVGPMTVTMLLSNTVSAAERLAAKNQP